MMALQNPSMFLPVVGKIHTSIFHALKFISLYKTLIYSHSLLMEMENTSTPGKEAQLTFAPEEAFMHADGPYAFGMDPIWNIAENRLNFFNSMKMKLSVILGISQMTFGVFLSLQNYRFFKSKIDIYTVFIPQLLFLSCIFIYLCLQIIMKWIFFWVVPDTIFGFYYPGSHCAPSLLVIYF